MKTIKLPMPDIDDIISNISKGGNTFIKNLDNGGNIFFNPSYTTVKTILNTCPIK